MTIADIFNNVDALDLDELDEEIPFTEELGEGYHHRDYQGED